VGAGTGAKGVLAGVADVSLCYINCYYSALLGDNSGTFLVDFCFCWGRQFVFHAPVVWSE
jgi:hypothetical protein